MPTTRSLLSVPDAKIKKIEQKKEEKPAENKVTMPIENKEN
jgi:hypothetical protein